MMRALFIACLVNLVASQAVTVNAISQIGDGQIQAPTGPQPPAPAPPAASAVPAVPPPPEPPIATDSVPYSNPVTSYATGSESWVVVTSVPTVTSAQPQPPLAPPASQAIVTPPTNYNNGSTTLQPPSEPVVETTVVVTSSRAPSSPSIASVSGAEMNRVTGAGLALLIVSVGFFML